MAVTMVRDFSGRGEISSRRLQSNEPQKEMKLGGDVERPEFSDLVKDFAKDVNDLQLQVGYRAGCRRAPGDGCRRRGGHRPRLDA